MADISTLGIKVTTDGVKQAKTQLDGLATAGGKAEKSTESLTREIKQQDKAARATSRSVGGLVGALGALAGTVIIERTISAIIRNTIEQERATALLNSTLKATGRLTPELSQGLQDYAKELQNVTTFGDEAILSVQTFLLTFAQIGGEEFTRANKVVLDMSTLLGTDLKTASIQVGKALNDPIRGVTALADAGVSFSQSQRDLIKRLVETNQVAEAQKIILKELEFEFGGAAEAARNTLGGAVSALKNAFGDLLEGDSGGEGVRGATDAVNELADTLNSPGIRAGFQAVVSLALGALNALAQFAATTSNVTQFLAEEFSARLNGPILTETVRVEQAIERTIANIERMEETLRQGRVAGEEGFREDIAQERAKLAELQKQLEIGKQINAEARKTAADFTGPNVPRATPSGSPGATGGSNRAAAAARAEAAARAKLAREEEAMARKLEQLDLKRAADNEAFASSLEDVEALLAGPLAQAELQHIRNLEEIARVGAEAGVSQDLINRAKDGELERYRRENEEIERRLDVGGQLLEDLEFELSLIGLSNTQRQTAIALRGLETEQVEKYGDAIRTTIESIEAEQRAVEAMDGLRNSLSDTFASIIDGSKSAKDAFADFAQAITAQVARMLADRAVQQLLGGFGTNSTGGNNANSGGFIASIVGALFGGGSAKGNAFSGGNVLAFAKGGVVDRTTPFGMSGGRFGIMGEAGPEAILPLHRGRDGKLGVKAANDDNTRGALPQLNSNVTVNVTGRVDRRTVDQIATESGRRLRIAGRNQ